MQPGYDHSTIIMTIDMDSVRYGQLLQCQMSRHIHRREAAIGYEFLCSVFLFRLLQIFK